MDSTIEKKYNESMKKILESSSFKSVDLIKYMGKSKIKKNSHHLMLPKLKWKNSTVAYGIEKIHKIKIKKHVLTPERSGKVYFMIKVFS